MPRGNFTNHKRKYFTCDAFQHWVDNDFKHICRRIDFQNVKINFLMALLAIILALLAILVVKII